MASASAGLMTFLKLLIKLVAISFAMLLAWAIMEDMPRWALNVLVLALLIVALSLWAKCDAWSKRFLLRAGYEEWSKTRAEIISIFLKDHH